MEFRLIGGIGQPRLHPCRVFEIVAGNFGGKQCGQGARMDSMTGYQRCHADAYRQESYASPEQSVAIPTEVGPLGHGIIDFMAAMIAGQEFTAPLHLRLPLALRRVLALALRAS